MDEILEEPFKKAQDPAKENSYNSAFRIKMF